MSSTSWGVMPVVIQPLDDNITLSFSGSTALTASTHKHAVTGQIVKTGNVRSIGFRFGAITKGGTTELTLSLQDASTTAGPPAQPDGTQDQTATIGNADITANTWRTIQLGTDRAVTVGDEISVVWEFSTFNTGDSIVFSHHTIATGGQPAPQECVLAHFNGTSWANLVLHANIVLVYDDGTAATLLGAHPADALTSVNFNNGSTPDERGNIWTAPMDLEIAGLVCYYTPSADADLVLYNSSGTELASVAVLSEQTRTAANRMYAAMFSAGVAVTGGQSYYLTLRPSTATNVSITALGVAAAAHLGGTQYGTAMYSAVRTNAGAWTTDTAVQHPIGVIVSKFGGGTGGGSVALPLVRAF